MDTGVIKRCASGAGGHALMCFVHSPAVPPAVAVDPEVDGVPPAEDGAWAPGLLPWVALVCRR